jgi:3-oxoadipate enol-lactonase
MLTEQKGYQLRITVNDFEVSYDDIGEGDVPVIFLHGFPFSKAMWRQQLDFLRNLHRVIAVDIRGFGASTDEESALSMDLFADDLLGLMDRLSIEKAIVCGLSMGGYIALNAHSRFPERLAGLILCDTQCIADTPEVKEKRLQTIADVQSNGASSFNEGFIKLVFHNDSLSHKKELVESLRKVVDANSSNIIAAGLKALAERAETCSTLGTISIPTLIICGREDEVTPLEQSEAMHQQIQGSILQVIDFSGHVSNLEHPDEFNEYLLDFLSGLNMVTTKNFPENNESIK